MKSVIFYALRYIPAIILLQTLFFKFSGAEVSVYIFKSVDDFMQWTAVMEPYGRIFTGIIELVAGLLLLWPKQSHWGAFLSMGVIFGALMTHLVILGIDVKGDHGKVFYLGLLTFICNVIVVYQNRKSLPILKSIF
jgi:uncharacterized membrane protein YphA (DoxX/SURF4 family)